MSEGDQDYETMKRVLKCENPREVQEVLNDYKDEEFSHFVHTKQTLAQTLVAREKSEPNKRFLHQLNYTKRVTLTDTLLG